MNVYLKADFSMQEERLFSIKGESFHGLQKLTDSEVKEFYLSKKDGYHIKPNTYPLEWELNEVVDTVAQTEYYWAKSELNSSDVEITYHNESSSRAKATLQEWYNYREALRDYATESDGVYSYVGERPTSPS